MFKKNILFVVCLVFIFLPLVVCQAATVSAPTIVSIQKISSNECSITGVTKSGTDVFIFLNGAFVGSAVVKDQPGVASSNFVYQLKQKTSLEKKVVTALARDSKTLVISDYSATMIITAETNQTGSGSETKTLSAPTLISPNTATIIGKSRPTIIGYTVGGTNVEIFIDEVYVGETGTTSDSLITANFSFVPDNDLAVGQHQVFAVAKNEKEQRSTASEPLTFNIEDKLPAPILEEPIANQDNLYKPLFVGLTYSQTGVFIYVDDKLVGRAKVEKKESGVTSFAYQVQEPLTKGGHLVYTVAIDQRGKESDRSNYIYYLVGESGEPMITDQAVEEIDGSSKEQESRTEDELAGILKPGEDQEKNAGAGMINEARENIASLKWNVAIFLSFLLAVIVWIFWVNRELIKEKSKQNQDGNSEENKQDKLI